MKKLWFLLVLTIAVPLVKAQSFTYTFVDPCTGNPSIVQVPIDPNKNITVSYYKQVNTFGSNDFNNGVFSQWVDDVFSKYQGKSPCAGIGTVVTNDISQGTSFSVIGILNSLSAVASNSAGGAVSTTSSIGAAGSSSGSGGGKSGTKSDKKADKKAEVKADGKSSEGDNPPQGGSGETGTPEAGQGNSGDGQAGTNPPNGGSGDGTSGDGSSGSGTSGSGSNGEGSGGNGGSGGGEEGGGTPPDKTDAPEEKKTDFTTGNNNAIRSTPSSSNDKKGGGSAGANAQKPTIIGSSDFVGISGNSDEENPSNLGIKINGGYTSTRWDGMTSHGVMVDYTSTINGPNITGFYAWIGGKAITLAANTVTIGFEGKGSIYNTVAFGQLRNVKNMKVIYLVSATAGHIYQENFLGTSAIFGGMYDYQMNKRIAIKFTALGVYAPFVRYYADAVLSSPFVVLPSIGTNLALSKSFMINVNAGGAYSFENKVLNYTITSGLRMAIGT